jgi:lysophospholipase L1-like esterase
MKVFTPNFMGTLLSVYGFVAGGLFGLPPRCAQYNRTLMDTLLRRVRHQPGRVRVGALWMLMGLTTCAQPAFAQAPRLELRQGDTIVFVGNTLAERMQHFNHFETLLMTRFPELQLRVRNLAWSGDTITLQPRPLNFGDAATHLQRQKADVIFAFFGLNESFDGEAGLLRFEQDLDAYLKTHLAARYNGRTAPRLVLVSPIAHEPLERLQHVDVDARNRELERYTTAMARVASRNRVPFADLFTATREVIMSASGPATLTTNGIHVNETGDAVVGGQLMHALGFEPKVARKATGASLKQLEALRDDIREKNEQFFYRWRPVNAEYVVGRRVEPFGSKSFPPEMERLDRLVSDLDARIWKRAAALKDVVFPPPSPAATTAAKGRN